MFGSLFGRTFRLLQIITRSKFSPIKFTDLRLLGFVGILVGVDVLILIVWTASTPIDPVVVRPDPLRPILDFQTCLLTGPDFIFIGILACYKGLILIAGLYLAVRIWNIKLRGHFNESRPLAFSMYNMVFFMLLAVVAVAVFNSADDPYERAASYILRSTAVLLGVFLTKIVIFIPKISAVYRIPMGSGPSGGDPNFMSDNFSGARPAYGSSALGTSSGTDTETDTRLKAAEAKIAELQEKLADLRSENKNLKEELVLTSARLPASEVPSPRHGATSSSSRKAPLSAKKPAPPSSTSSDEDSEDYGTVYLERIPVPAQPEPEPIERSAVGAIDVDFARRASDARSDYASDYTDQEPDPESPHYDDEKPRRVRRKKSGKIRPAEIPEQVAEEPEDD